MTEPILPPLKPIPIKDRVSVLFVEKGNLDVLDGAFVVVDKNGVRTHIPVGGVACRDAFRQARILHRIIPTIEEDLAAGEVSVPKPHEEAVEVAIPNKEGMGDAGHRG